MRRALALDDDGRTTTTIGVLVSIFLGGFSPITTPWHSPPRPRKNHTMAHTNISRIAPRPRSAPRDGGRRTRAAALTHARAPRRRATSSGVREGFSRRNIIHIFIAHARGFERTHTHTTTQA